MNIIWLMRYATVVFRKRTEVKRGCTDRYPDPRREEMVVLLRVPGATRDPKTDDGAVLVRTSLFSLSAGSFFVFPFCLQ